MESLQDIMGGRDYSPPSEVEAIQDYIQRRYKSKCRIHVQDTKITISVRSAALANTLRLEQNRLIEACSLDKQLHIRIG